MQQISTFLLSARHGTITRSIPNSRLDIDVRYMLDAEPQFSPLFLDPLSRLLENRKSYFEHGNQKLCYNPATSVPWHFLLSLALWYLMKQRIRRSLVQLWKHFQSWEVMTKAWTRVVLKIQAEGRASANPIWHHRTWSKRHRLPHRALQRLPGTKTRFLALVGPTFSIIQRTSAKFD